MKIVRVKEKESSKITRKLISNFGESIYYDPGVKSVFIKVNFKNGSSISFRRDEIEDEWEAIEKEIKEEEE